MLGFLAAAVLIYAVLQIVALRVLDGVRWRLAFGVAIPAAACTIIGVIGAFAGISFTAIYFLLFAPLGAAVLALILGSHVLANMRRR